MKTALEMLNTLPMSLPDHRMDEAIRLYNRYIVQRDYARAVTYCLNWPEGYPMREMCQAFARKQIRTARFDFAALAKYTEQMQ